MEQKPESKVNQAERAIAAIASQMLKIHKGTNGKNNPYASFEDIIDALRQPMQDVGLAVGFDFSDQGNTWLRVRCTHLESMDSAERRYPFSWSLPEKACGSDLKDSTGTACCQDLGKAMTYTKRYALIMLFCLVTTENDPDDYGEAMSPAKTRAPIAGGLED